MKKYRDYVPGSDAGLLQWLTLLDHQFTNNINNTDDTPGNARDQLTEMRELMALLQEVDAVKKKLTGLVALKNRKKKRVVHMLRNTITCAKRGSGFATGIINSMPAVCKAIEFDREMMAPHIKASCYPGIVEIVFDKKILTPVHIYSRHNQEEWKLLNICQRSPYRDKRPLSVPDQPERREYKAVYVKDDYAIGQFSNIVSVTYDG